MGHPIPRRTQMNFEGSATPWTPPIENQQILLEVHRIIRHSVRPELRSPHRPDGVGILASDTRPRTFPPTLLAQHRRHRFPTWTMGRMGNLTNIVTLALGTLTIHFGDCLTRHLTRHADGTIRHSRTHQPLGLLKYLPIHPLGWGVGVRPRRSGPDDASTTAKRGAQRDPAGRGGRRATRSRSRRPPPRRIAEVATAPGSEAPHGREAIRFQRHIFEGQRPQHVVGQLPTSKPDPVGNSDVSPYGQYPDPSSNSTPSNTSTSQLMQPHLGSHNWFSQWFPNRGSNNSTSHLSHRTWTASPAVTTAKPPPSHFPSDPR
jgi:hypothetical protein